MSVPTADPRQAEAELLAKAKAGDFQAFADLCEPCRQSVCSYLAGAGLADPADAEDGLDPDACRMVGDKVSDLECGVAAGVRAVLVARGSTGAPREDAAAFAAARGIPVFESFPAFVRDLLSRIPDGPEKKK